MRHYRRYLNICVIVHQADYTKLEMTMLILVKTKGTFTTGATEMTEVPLAGVYEGLKPQCVSIDSVRYK